ncbi:MAG TPA: tetratricopeptide repeat protein [Blastocatellia bacterium]|nr:tetratricopeptide repeat protein [Blastocatellia bacterium]
MQTTGDPLSAKQRRTWLIPGLIAAVSFIGGVASNLLASDLEEALKPYRNWVWLLCTVAFIIAVVAAIRDHLQINASLPPGSSPVPQNLPGSSVIALPAEVPNFYAAMLPAVHALHQLPPPPRDFTGRKAELEELMEKLQYGGIAISGLRGQGGAGKTTLALKLAERLTPHYPDAQFYLNLKGTSPQPLTTAEVMSHVIRAYYPTTTLPASETELSGWYRSVLDGKRALLLMDNAKDRTQVEPLIPPASCILLITSRQHFVLPGLYAKSLDMMSPIEARELLIRIEPRIGKHADEIARLCRYLPLALRLAASTLAERPNIDPVDYAQQLAGSQKQLELIEASLSLSYDLLSGELQQRWRALAVFPESFDEVGAAAIWEVGKELAREELGNLLAFSLVEWNEATHRYRLPDLTRVFAESRMSDTEREVSRRRHAAHYQRILISANALYLQSGDGVERGLALFDLELLNIEAGQAWTVERTVTDDTAAELCIAYPETGVDLLLLRQHPRERVQWLEAMLAAAQRLNRSGAESVACSNLGFAYHALGETRRAIEFSQQALEITRRTGDRKGELRALSTLSIAYITLGEASLAIEFSQQQVASAREIGDRRSEGWALGNLGEAYSVQGDKKRAIEFQKQWLMIARETGDRRNEGWALGRLAGAYADLGEARRAVGFYDQWLMIAREIGDRRGEGTSLRNLGHLYATLGKNSRTIELYEQALMIARETEDRRNEGELLWNMAMVLDRLGERARAVHCAEAALMICERIESPNAEKIRSMLGGWKIDQSER